MEAILEYWLKHIEEFSLIEERILYTAERLSFIPIFAANQKTLKFLEKVRKLINSTRSSEETENKEVVDIVVAAVEYLILRNEEHKKIESSDKKS